MSDIQYPTNGEKNVGFSAEDDCGNRTRGDRMVTIIQNLLAGRYVDIAESGDTATISVDPSADYYNKAEINEILGDLDTVQFKIVTALPAVGALNVIYLVAKPSPDTGYDQYIWNTDDNQFHAIGDTDIDLSDYYTKLQTYQKSEVYNKSEADAKFQEKLTDDGSITPVTDTTTFANINLVSKAVKSITGLSIWNYIVSKITGSASSAITTDLERSKVVVTDAFNKLNVSSVYSSELEQLSGINTTKTVQTQLNAKQDAFTYSGEIAVIDDDTGLGVVNLYAKTVSTIIGSTIWTYIKSKFNADTISTVTDSTEMCMVDKSKTNPVQKFTASVLFTYMWKKIYPVGSIYISASSTSPATLFGGTWEQIQGRFLCAAGNNGESGNANLNKSLGATGGTYRHQHEYGLRHNVYYGQGANSTSDADSIQLSNYNTSNTQSWKSGSQNGNAQGRHASWSGEGSLSRFDVTANTKLTDSLPPYIAVNVWQRTA